MILDDNIININTSVTDCHHAPHGHCHVVPLATAQHGSARVACWPFH